MRKLFVPSRDTLHPNILETLEKNVQWHLEQGFEQMSVDEILETCFGMHLGAFTLLLQDGGERHHDNAAVLVFNAQGVLIDARIWFNPVGTMEVPLTTYLGTPVVDGSKPMEYKTHNKKDVSNL